MRPALVIRGGVSDSQLYRTSSTNKLWRVSSYFTRQSPKSIGLVEPELLVSPTHPRTLGRNFPLGGWLRCAAQLESAQPLVSVWETPERKSPRAQRAVETSSFWGAAPTPIIMGRRKIEVRRAMIITMWIAMHA